MLNHYPRVSRRRKKTADAESAGRAAKMNAVEYMNDFLLQSMRQKSTGLVSDRDAAMAFSGLCAYSSIKRIIKNSHVHLFKSLTAAYSIHSKVVFPFVPLDLRDILEQKQIVHSAPLVLFAPEAAYRFLPYYKCFLCLKREKIKSSIQAGGILVCDNHRLDVSEGIDSIVVTDERLDSTIRSIVQDVEPSISVYQNRMLPGFGEQKFAQTNIRYKVNILPLKINTEIMADNEKDAVQKALSFRWDRHPDSKHRDQPANYQMEYWLHSGFWDSIVRKA